MSGVDTQRLANFGRLIPFDGAEPKHRPVALVERIEATGHHIVFASWLVQLRRRQVVDGVQRVFETQYPVPGDGSDGSIKVCPEIGRRAPPVMKRSPNSGVSIGDDFLGVEGTASDPSFGIVERRRVIARPKRPKCIIDTISDPFDQGCVVEQCQFVHGHLV